MDLVILPSEQDTIQADALLLQLLREGGHIVVHQHLHLVEGQILVYSVNNL